MCKFKKGTGLWKFKCSLLKNRDCLICINNLIEREKVSYALPVYNPVTVSELPNDIIKFIISDSQFLEGLLLQIRGETIKYSCALKRNLVRRKALIKEIGSLENKNDEVNYVQLAEKRKR